MQSSVSLGPLQTVWRDIRHKLESVSKDKLGQIITLGKNGTNILGYPLPATCPAKRMPAGSDMSSNTGNTSDHETVYHNCSNIQNVTTSEREPFSLIYGSIRKYCVHRTSHFIFEALQDLTNPIIRLSFPFLGTWRCLSRRRQWALSFT